VIVIPLRSDGTILVTKEWRHSVKRYVYSFPGGLVDEGETPLQASRRELLEETGYGTEKTTLLGSCFPLPGLLQQTMSIIVAHDIYQICEPHKDPIEEISFDFYSMGDLQAKFRDSSDIDAMGLAAMALFWINVSPN
jgi:8-oxo-dGTP pyrophosphatase MutT (NUDIX family)